MGTISGKVKAGEAVSGTGNASTLKVGTPTLWSINTIASFGGSVKNMAGSFGQLILTWSSNPSRYYFDFVTAGLSVGPSLFPNLSGAVSGIDFKSWGSRMYFLPPTSGYLLQEEINGPCTMFSVDANLLGGISGTIVFMGTNKLTASLLRNFRYNPGTFIAKLALYKAVGFIAGMEVGIPGGSLTVLDGELRFDFKS